MASPSPGPSSGAGATILTAGVVGSVGFLLSKQKCIVAFGFRVEPLVLLASSKFIVVLLQCVWLSSLNPFIEFRIWNNSSSSDVLYIQANKSISPKYESK